MEEINETIILEENIEYGIVDKIIINGIEYLYLCDLLNSEEFVIRKVSENQIIGLKNEAEFDLALDNFKKKHEGIS